MRKPFSSHVLRHQTCSVNCCCAAELVAAVAEAGVQAHSSRTIPNSSCAQRMHCSRLVSALGALTADA